MRRQWLRRKRPSEPREDFGQSVPKSFHGQQRRQLVRQHMPPADLELGAVRLNINETGNADPLKGAFFRQHVEKLDGLGPRVGVPVKVDDVIKVARSRSLRERPKLLGERFDVIIGEDFHLGLAGICVRRAHRR